MAKKELFDTPVISWFIRAYKAISVDRSGNDIAAIKSAMKVLKDKNILGIFPEGTRVRDGIRREAKSGLAMIAYKLKVPVQPIKISYKRKFNLFNRIEITVGKSIYPDELGIETSSGEEYEKATNKLMDIVYSM
jgi:1-acyl-sn-glycerol-3-phosphate acyltransferase